MHQAAISGNREAVDILFKYEANPLIENKAKKTAIDLCTDPDTRKAIQRKIDIIKGVDKYMPPKPPCVQGYLYSCGSLKFTNKKRFFVLNPDDGTLMRFENKESYPYSPKEIVPLRSIKYVQRVP